MLYFIRDDFNLHHSAGTLHIKSIYLQFIWKVNISAIWYIFDTFLKKNIYIASPILVFRYCHLQPIWDMHNYHILVVYDMLWQIIVPKRVKKYDEDWILPEKAGNFIPQKVYLLRAKKNDKIFCS